MVDTENSNIQTLRIENKEAKKLKLRQGGIADERKLPKEYGGPKGLEPTRYGDWERNGLAVDF